MKYLKVLHIINNLIVGAKHDSEKGFQMSMTIKTKWIVKRSSPFDKMTPEDSLVKSIE